jgi:hypothetical protein
MMSWFQFHFSVRKNRLIYLVGLIYLFSFIFNYIFPRSLHHVIYFDDERSVNLARMWSTFSFIIMYPTIITLHSMVVNYVSELTASVYDLILNPNTHFFKIIYFFQPMYYCPCSHETAKTGNSAGHVTSQHKFLYFKNLSWKIWLLSCHDILLKYQHLNKSNWKLT